jgi:hypothetical protein
MMHGQKNIKLNLAVCRYSDSHVGRNGGVHTGFLVGKPEEE